MTGDWVSDWQVELESMILRKEWIYQEEKAANRELSYWAACTHYNAAVDKLELVMANLPGLAQAALDLDGQLSQVEVQMWDKIRQ